MEMLLGSSGFMFIGIAISFWILTSKKFRKQNGDEISYWISENIGGLSDSAHKANVLSLQEFKQELTEEYGISLEEADKEFDSYRKRRRGVNVTSTKGKSNDI